MQQRDENILRKIVSEIDHLEEALGSMAVEQFNADETPSEREQGTLVLRFGF